MEFKEKLGEYLNKLKKLPRCNKEDLYKWADYIELKCLANKDNFYAVSDFIDDSKPRAEDLGEGDFEETENDKKQNVSIAAKNDRWESLAKEALRIIGTRTQIYSEYYPFEVTKNGLAITLKDKLNLNEKKYLFLLLSANLQYSFNFMNELTGSFEYMCKCVLKELLPNKSEVRVFGSSNSEKPDTDFIELSKFWDKLKYLEVFLKEKLMIQESDINKYNRGDGGLDLVAKIPLGDEQSHFPIVFGQCACSPTDWISKQHTIKGSTWRPIMSLKTNPHHYIFIPQCYRESTGDWFDKTKIHETILVDRQRILNNFTADEKFEKYSSFPIVEEISKLKEDIF